jgi:hypothetical protein
MSQVRIIAALLGADHNKDRGPESQTQLPSSPKVASRCSSGGAVSARRSRADSKVGQAQRQKGHALAAGMP